jgi:C4-dicarboxylate-specific signal transduction histidine kinase
MRDVHLAVDPGVVQGTAVASAVTRPAEPNPEELHEAFAQLTDQVGSMQRLLGKAEERRRAMLHIMADINEANKRLGDQRKAMLHILSDYEDDRRELARQTEQLRNTRRALLHILQDSHRANQRLERSRKAMIHIMGDLRDTTHEMQRREQELREKQAQLVQAAKLATLGELTTGVAHELNNPLNNIGLYVGNIIDSINLGGLDIESTDRQLRSTMDQVQKATEIISHLRTFGRAAPAQYEKLLINQIVEQSLSLLREQMRLRSIHVELDLSLEEPVVFGNSIQLEQVFMNLLTNARDALSGSDRKVITICSRMESEIVKIVFHDTGPGIPIEFEQRVFDPFFTTKEVGAGTGLGLSIAYGIVKDHAGAITLVNRPGEGVTFVVELPLASARAAAEATT